MEQYITEGMLCAWNAGDASLESIYYNLKKEHPLVEYSKFVDTFITMAIQLFG